MILIFRFPARKKTFPPPPFFLLTMPEYCVMIMITIIVKEEKCKLTPS